MFLMDNNLLIMILEITLYIFSLYFFYYLFRNIKFSYAIFVIVFFQIIAIILMINSFYTYGYTVFDMILEIFTYEIIISMIYFGVYKVDLKFSNLLETLNNLHINYITLSSFDDWRENTIDDLISVLKDIDNSFLINKKLKTLGKLNMNESKDGYIIKIMIWGKENEPFPNQIDINHEVSIESYKNGYEYTIRHTF